MPSLYQVMDVMKGIFTKEGYKVYDIQEFDDNKITRLDPSEFPVICIGRQIEEIDNDGSPINFLDEESGIDLNVVLNTGRGRLEQDSDIELRKIKNIIGNNKNKKDNWCDWKMTDNFVAQLANSNDRADVYGGININTTVEYRELEIEPEDITAVPIHFRDTVFNGRTDSNQTGTIGQTLFQTFDSDGIEATWSNNYRVDFVTYGANTNPIIIKASIEINGLITPLYFDGEREYTLAEGEVKTCDKLDIEILSSDFIKIYTYFDAGIDGYVPNGYKMTGSGSSFEGADALEYGIDLVDVGTVNRPSSLFDLWGACNVLSTPKVYKPSVLLIGDSIMRSGDRWDYTKGNQGKDGINGGYMTIALKNDGIPFTNISCGGERAENFFTDISSREPFINGHKYVVGNYGANDIFNNSETFEELRDYTLDIWKYFKVKGMKIVWTTLLPKTDSTDDYFTEANQTVEAQENERLKYNDWLLNEAPNEYGNMLYDVIDVNTEAQSGQVWKEYAGNEHEGFADNNSTTTNLYDLSIPETVEDGEWQADSYIVITGGTNFGEDPRLVGNYTKSLRRVIFFPAYPVAPDDTTEYYIKRVPTTDGLHPKNGTVNLRTSQAVDTTIFK